MAAARLNVIVRSFSSSAAVQQMVKPPIQIFGLEGRYAHALFSGASKLKQLDSVEKDLVSLQDQIKKDAKLKELLLNPSIKRNLKVDAIKVAAQKTNLSLPVANLLGLLAENGRLKNLSGIITAFTSMMAAVRGEVPCEVTTAKPLDAAMLKEVEGALKNFTKSGQKVLLTTKVDPSIIGGMIVSIGDKYVDMSIASKVKKYTQLISSAV